MQPQNLKDLPGKYVFLRRWQENGQNKELFNTFCYVLSFDGFNLTFIDTKNLKYCCTAEEICSYRQLGSKEIEKFRSMLLGGA